MQLARYYLERLITGCANYREGKKTDPAIVFHKFAEFPELTTVKFPTVETLHADFRGIEDAT